MVLISSHRDLKSVISRQCLGYFYLSLFYVSGGGADTVFIEPDLRIFKIPVLPYGTLIAVHMLII